MRNALISIVTPTFNRADYLKETIPSVLQQTYSDFELLIVDNGSTDHTEEVVRSFGDSRVRYFRQDNSGSPVSPRNRALRNASGDIICFLDSDDVWLPEKLERQMAEFRRLPDLVMSYADCFLINRIGENKGRYSSYHTPYFGKVFERLLESNFIPAVTVAVRREMVSEFGPLNEHYLIAHDLDFYLKVAARHQISYVPEPLAKLRIHSVGLSRNRVVTRLEIMEIIDRWASSGSDNLSPDAARRIRALNSFMTGLEILHHEKKFGSGRQWFTKAIQNRPLVPAYWAGLLLSLIPPPLGSMSVALAKKRRSVEWAMES